MYEDSLEFSNQALKIDKNNTKATFRKAKSLAFLHQFTESLKILNNLKKDQQVSEEIEKVKSLES